MLKLNIRTKSYRIDLCISLLYFSIAILFLIFSDGFLRYVLNFFLLVLTFAILYFSSLNNKYVFIFFATIFYVSYIALSVLIVGNKINVTSLISFYSFFFLSYIFLYSDEGKRYLKFFYIYYYFSVVVICFLLLTGVEAADIFSGSRNAISLLLVPLGSIFLLDKRVNTNNKYAFLLYFLVFLSCVIAQGRSGIITSLLLLIGLAFSSFDKINYRKIFSLIIFSLVFSVLLNFYIETIYNLSYFDYLRNKGIDDGIRESMREEYISSLKAVNILFGVNTSQLPIISSFNSNPHNTYLYLHSNLGFIFILTTIFAIFYWLKTLVMRSFVSFLVLSALLLRLGTDSTSSIAILPLIFASLMFFQKKDFRRRGGT